jgi:hypothetical protein
LNFRGAGWNGVRGENPRWGRSLVGFRGECQVARSEVRGERCEVRGEKTFLKSEGRLQKLRRLAGVSRVERSETIRSPQPKS